MKRRLSQIRPSTSLQSVLDGAMIILEDLDNPISLSVYLLLKYKEYDQIVNMDIQVDDYDYSANAYFFDCYTAVSLVKKLEELPTTIDRSATAFKKFLEAEVQCAQTNDRLLESHVSNTREGLETSNLLSKVSYELKCILGSAPSIGDLHCGFGPGSSSSCEGTKVTVADKLKSRPEIGSLLLEDLQELVRSDPHFGAAVFNVGGEVSGPFSALEKPHVVNFNKLSFVPKNGKTDRAICVEPTLNSYIQSGIGLEIRKRLFLTGLDLSKQHQINAAYAKKGSVDGSYATIDLSAASDTISSQLVLEILPMDWFDLLYKARSPYTLLPNGKLLENNKFSSMGNGYTFELESAIFLAITRVVYSEMKSDYDWARNEFMTFGDDIIVPTPAASKVIHYLEVLGFGTNIEKTFLSGPFRESCGKDYFNGHLVRPLFITKIPADIRGYYSICNGTRHLSKRHSALHYCDARFRRGWNFFLSKINKRERHFGPQEFGDQVLFTNRQKSVRSDINGSTVCTLLLGVQEKSDQCKYRSNVVLQVCRMGQPSRVSLRGLTDRVGFKRVLVPFWDKYVGQWDPD